MSLVTNPIGVSSPVHRSASHAAFTLIELLVCAGIISLLIAILLPTLTAARANARQLVCANNVRQLCQGMFLYANFNRGNLPLNVVIPRVMYWYDADRLGRILAPGQSLMVGGIVACPDDIGGVRSYAMNVWASSTTDSTTSSNGFGTLWRLNVPGAERYILIAEKWSSSGSATAGWVSTATLAGTKDTPGRRFGGGVGITPILSSGHFGQANSELPYQRHRSRNGPGRLTQPLGRVNIGYADGHVALKSNADLVDAMTGLSTMDSVWSPKDFELNK